ncbi:MAG: hypothetical protein IK118_03335 [Clostridia bacterium]|nr:hypothetical protein [Clostridia bacterium]
MKRKSILSAAAVFCLSLMIYAVLCLPVTAGTADKNYTVDTEKTVGVILDGAARTLYEKKMLCDINGDGKFNSSDAALILRIAAKREQPPENVAPYDLDEDGSLKSADARLALRYSARLDKYYCFEDESVPVGMLPSADKAGFYYFSPAGVRASGLKTIDGALYSFDDSTGLACVGFRTVNGAPYHFEADGKGSTGEYRSETEEKTLRFENGAAVNGFRTADGKSYYYVDGEKMTDWQQVGGKWYYFGADGAMTLGKITLGGLIYDFGTDGVSKTGRTGKAPRVAVIGDSIVASLAIYLSDTSVDFYGKVSLHANTIFNKKISGSSRYIIDEIKDRGYDKVIVLLGVNDLTYADGAWGEMYRKVIRGVKERTPDAEVIAHGITPVNDARARSHGYGDTTMARVRNKNSVIANIASQEGVRYIDASSVMTDQSGQLPYEAASDGIHFGSKYCRIWLDWLKQTI